MSLVGFLQLEYAVFWYLCSSGGYLAEPDFLHAGVYSPFPMNSSQLVLQLLKHQRDSKIFSPANAMSEVLPVSLQEHVYLL